MLRWDRSTARPRGVELREKCGLFGTRELGALVPSDYSFHFWR